MSYKKTKPGASDGQDRREKHGIVFNVDKKENPENSAATLRRKDA